MQAQDFKEFKKYWNITLKSKGQEALDSDVITTIFYDLSNYTLDDVMKALQAFRINPDEGQYKLQVSAIVKILSGDSNSASMKAWAMVWKIATSIGGYDDLVINDRLTMKCIGELGGLQRLCGMKDEKSLEFYGNEFRSLYKHYRINGVLEPVEVLRGTNNVQLEMHGQPTRPPRMIGFEKQRIPLPDFSKPRYKQIENPKAVSNDEARKNLTKFIQGE